MESGPTRRVKLFHRGSALAQAFSGEGQTVGIADEPVENGVNQGRIFADRG